MWTEHVIDLDWMREAFRLTRKDGAPGIDGVTAKDYEANLEANLSDLLERIKMLWGLAAARFAAGPPGVHPKSGWLAKDARHSNPRGQGGAARRHDGAGGGLRTGLLALFLRLPPGPLGSPGAPHFAERTLGQATLRGDRHRQRLSAIRSGTLAMRCAQITRVAALAVALTLLAPHAAVAAGDKGKPGSCNITTGGIGPGGDTAICNYGLTPEELKQVTEAAVKGATGPLIDRIADISKTLGVTEDAAKTLLKIVGEDPNIPEDKLAEALTRVAGDYKRLEAQVAALNPDNPTAKALVEQAKPEIEAGHFQRAHELLGQATQAQVAAAQQAYQIQEQARVAGDAQMLGAASSTSADGEVATTERRYLEAAALFGQAASYVPSGHASERGGYLLRQAYLPHQIPSKPLILL